MMRAKQITGEKDTKERQTDRQTNKLRKRVRKIDRTREREREREREFDCGIEKLAERGNVSEKMMSETDFR